MAVKKKSVKRKSVKRKSVKKKTVKKKVCRKKVSSKKKCSPKKKARKKVKKNPARYFNGYIPYVLSDGKKLFYHGINFSKKGLRFSETSTGKAPVLFSSRKEAVSHLVDMIKTFIPNNKKLTRYVGAELIGPKT